MSKKGPDIRSFIDCVRAYLPTETHVRERTGQGQPGAYVSPGSLKQNRFYFFDEEARQAFFHAIEDLAMEEAAGSLISLMSGFKEFDADRERYGHLAVTIDEVLVAGSGRQPKPVHRVSFQSSPPGRLREYRLSSFAGSRSHAAFICRQVASGRAGAGRFLGFFTLNGRIANRMRVSVVSALRGQGSPLQEFERLQAIDQAARQLETDFLRQKQAVEEAMVRLQVDGGKSSKGKLATELEKGASQLAEWKTRLSTMLSRLPGPMGS